MDKILPIRPYARLLTMLSQQLIKNEKIALIELIKNSYDADASWVQIRFVNFHEGKDENILKTDDNSYIEIEDDGDGMSMDTIKNDWMNPATPTKYKKKKENKIYTTRKNRIIQGDKGIGRFAVYKLGAKVEIYSRSIDKDSDEIYINSDFSKYDDDFTQENSKDKEIYLDQIKVDYDITLPNKIKEKEILIRNEKEKRKPYGTIIKISCLRGSWTKSKIEDIYQEVLKLEFPFKKKNLEEEFVIDILLNGKCFYMPQELEKRLTGYMGKAPITIKDGLFDDTETAFLFKCNNKNIMLNLDKLKGIKEFKSRFCDKKTGEKIRDPQCGPFKYEFYIFDFTSVAPPKFNLTEEDKKTIKNHRIYLYRDDIRVYPYGDPDDDWLGIDVLRGIGRAGDYLSMDQTIGFISISHKNNPKLKDKTNREGLLEIDGAFEDFKVLIQSILGYAQKEYKKYKQETENKTTQDILKQNKIENDLHNLAEELRDKKDIKNYENIKKIYHDYSNERKYLIERFQKTEDLAAVGLAVECTSHDIMLMIGRAKDSLDLLIKMSSMENVDLTKIYDEIAKLRGQISFIEDQLRGIQPLFRSTIRQSKKHRISIIVEKVKKYFDSAISKSNISINIEEKSSPLIVNCVEGILLQTFINLFDNSIYWLNTINSKNKQIKILINGENYEVIFSDNGPGVETDDLPYIFNAFFSTKGIRGRGLGLYIAKQLLERHDYEIGYYNENKKKLLSGANFNIKFISEED